MWHEERLLIDGKLVEAEGGGTFDNINPATGEVLGSAGRRVARRRSSGRSTAARRAFDDDRRGPRPRPPRSGACASCTQALLHHQDDLATSSSPRWACPCMLTRRPAARRADRDRALVRRPRSRSYEWTEDLGMAEVRGGNHHRWVEKEAVGVVAAIVPYNYPIQITLAKLSPALAAGCTVVVKGPPDTPWVTPALARDRGRDRHPRRRRQRLIVVELGRGRRAAHHRPDVDMVSFTGSTAVGRRIMAAGQRHGEAGVPRARRQVGLHRPRRRRPRPGRDDRRLHHLLPRRAGLRHHQPAARPPSRSSTRRSTRCADMLAGVPYGDPDRPGAT